MNDLFEIAKKYNLDKLILHTYIAYYNKLFQNFEVTNMLEIGIGLKSHEDEMKIITNNYIGGNSLLMWKDYFNQAIVHGIDIYNTNRFDNDDRIKTYICDQSSKEQLNNLVKKTGDFDLIIDDGSHKYSDQKISLENLIYNVKPNGMYIIEDVFNKHLDKLVNLYEFDKNVKDYIINNFYISIARDTLDMTLYRTHILPENIRDQSLLIYKRKPMVGM
jgi:hypothetical protein